MKNAEELRKTADKLQKVHYELLNGSSYDVIPRDSLDTFKTIIGHYVSKDVACKIFAKITCRNSDLIYRILLVNCLNDGGICTVPVIRVLENQCSVFYDSHCHKYSGWQDFLCHNKLPECYFLYPENGSYVVENGKVRLGMKKSPASGNLAQTKEYLYLTAEFISLVSNVSPLFSVAKPFATYIKWASGLSSGYQTDHNSFKVYGHYTHHESCNLTDEEALLHWSHLGNGFFTFALRYWTIDYGNLSGEPDWKNLVNLLTIYQKVMQDINPTKALIILRGHILSQHLLEFSNDATVIFQRLVSSNFDIYKLLVGVRCYLGDNISALRRLLYVDKISLSKVWQDVRDSNDVHVKMQTREYDFIPEKVSIVVNIMKEINLWKSQGISDNQLQFRITEICKNGNKMYETVSEMCLYFKVANLENINVNGRMIFQNVGTGKSALQNLIDRAAKKHPQLLLYAVEYASSQNGTIDWDGFTDYFKSRIAKERLGEILVNSGSSDIHWIHARSLQEVRTSATSENIIDLYKPSMILPHSVCVQDLVNLGKKVLGSIAVYMTIANPVTNWVVIISKTKKIVVMIGPKIEMLNNSLDGSYPVFIMANEQHF